MAHNRYCAYEDGKQIKFYDFVTKFGEHYEEVGMIAKLKDGRVEEERRDYDVKDSFVLVWKNGSSYPVILIPGDGERHNQIKSDIERKLKVSLSQLLEA